MKLYKENLMRIGNRERYYVYMRDNKRCFYCSRELKYNQITLDHFYPSSLGGRGEIFNLVSCCKRCNKIKGDRVPDDYEETIICLFRKAVEDGFIAGKDLKLKNSQLIHELLNVERLEEIGRGFIFQSRKKRFYIMDGFVIKIVYI